MKSNYQPWNVNIDDFPEKEDLNSQIKFVLQYAILEAVYTDILKKPEEIVKDINEMQEYPDYKRAWEIVKKEGYRNIISKLKF